MAELKALILIKYEVEPKNYESADPRDMINADFEADAAATILDAEWTVVSAELNND